MTILVSVLEQSCRNTARLKSVVHGRWKVGSEKERIMQPDEHPGAQDDLETEDIYTVCYVLAAMEGGKRERERERERIVQPRRTPQRSGRPRDRRISILCAMCLLSTAQHSTA